ncbi:hypothetical protein AB0F81_44980, partial [Actinoplanes sp. NPDC024001]|uniref:hypothetical protein n=1 Tax=Actinoplanes sp. NPDC024001 TaxID=3154598 RepID=UPI0034050E8C
MPLDEMPTTGRSTVDPDAFDVTSGVPDRVLARATPWQAGGTVVNEHTLDYNANGHRTRDVAKTMNADS